MYRTPTRTDPTYDRNAFNKSFHRQRANMQRDAWRLLSDPTENNKMFSCRASARSSRIIEMHLLAPEWMFVHGGDNTKHGDISDKRQSDRHNKDQPPACAS